MGGSHEWSMQFPDIKAAASTEAARAVFGMAWGGLGYPESWYTRGDETNRATAAAQGDPTWKSLQQKQDEVQTFIEWILEFVRDQAMIAGKYRPAESAETDITLVMPEMTTKDTGQISAALSSLILALQAARDAAWMTDTEAAQVLSKLVAELGVDIDVSRVEELAEREASIGGSKQDWERLHAPFDEQ